MKIRLISDLHLGINRCDEKGGNRFGFEQDNETLNSTDVILIAGDVGGSFKEDCEFYDRLLTQLDDTTKVFTIFGNHSYYDYDMEGITKTEGIKRLQKLYSKDDKVTFLENDSVTIGDYVFVGCTMYTDFSLYSDIEKAKTSSQYMINDFRYVHIYDNVIVRRVIPEDYENWYYESIKYIDDVCKENKDKKIVVLTHFLPTEECISSEYVGDSLNPFYCTELSPFIRFNKNIKLWCCGHSHSPCDCKIDECQIELYPYGYFSEYTGRMKDNILKPQEYFGKIIEI